MRHSKHGMLKDRQGQEQPRDKERAQTVHRSDPEKSVSHEATRDPKLKDDAKTPGPGMAPKDDD